MIEIRAISEPTEDTKPEIPLDTENANSEPEVITSPEIDSWEGEGGALIDGPHCRSVRYNRTIIPAQEH